MHRFVGAVLCAGAIPKELGALTNLTSLDLADSLLSGKGGQKLVHVQTSESGTSRVRVLRR